MPEAITRDTWVWTDTGVQPTPGDETYTGGQQPIAEYDNNRMWAVTNDIRKLSETLGDHSARHEAAGSDPINLDGLSVGRNPAATFTETGTPRSFNFAAGEAVDVLSGVDVTISNGGTASVTENVTVAVYQGTSTAGTLVASETISVTRAAGATAVTAFLETPDRILADGDYHVEVTGGASFTVVESTVRTLGGQYTFREEDGQFSITDQNGRERLRLPGIEGGLTVPDGPLTFSGDLQTSGGATIWDSVAGHIPSDRLQQAGLDAETVGGFGAADLVKRAGDTMTGNLTVEGNDASVILDESGVAGGIRARLTSANGRVEVGWYDPVAAAWDYSPIQLRPEQGEVQVEASGGFRVGTNTVWHAGNDGPGSGLDADTLDGYDSAAFGALAEAETVTGQWTFNSLVTVGSGVDITEAGTSASIQFKANANELYGMTTPGGGTGGWGIWDSANGRWLMLAREDSGIDFNNVTHRNVGNIYMSAASFIWTPSTTTSEISVADQSTNTYIMRFRNGTQPILAHRGLDMNQNQLLRARISNRTTDPTSPTEGQIWLRTDL